MTILEELINLRKAWLEEIVTCFAQNVPEKQMRPLLEKEKELCDEIAKLELQAADIIRRYQI